MEHELDHFPVTLLYVANTHTHAHRHRNPCLRGPTSPYLRLDVHCDEQRLGVNHTLVLN